MFAESSEGKIDAEGEENPQDAGNKALVIAGVNCLSRVEGSGKSGQGKDESGKRKDITDEEAIVGWGGSDGESPTGPPSGKSKIAGEYNHQGHDFDGQAG